MLFKFPKNDQKYLWTSHSKGKMMYYRISEQKIKLIISRPDRKETGIAPKTLAVMKRNDSAQRKQEMWVMYQTSGLKKKIISTWRYPGVSPKRSIPIPDDILKELE